MTLIISFSYMLFSDAQAQFGGEQAAAGATGQEFVRELNSTVTNAVSSMAIEGASVVIYVDSVKYVGRSTRADGTFDFRGAHITHGRLNISQGVLSL